MFLKVTLATKYRMLGREAVSEAGVSVPVNCHLNPLWMFLDSGFVLFEVVCFLVFYSFYQLPVLCVYPAC